MSLCVRECRHRQLKYTLDAFQFVAILPEPETEHTHTHTTTMDTVLRNHLRSTSAHTHTNASMPKYMYAKIQSAKVTNSHTDEDRKKKTQIHYGLIRVFARIAVCVCVVVRLHCQSSK